jgi:hypothetical protein
MGEATHRAVADQPSIQPSSHNHSNVKGKPLKYITI